MNTDIVALFNGLRGLVANLPGADSLMVYPNIPADVVSAVSSNFKLADSELPLYVFDPSFSGNYSQGIVATDMGVHFMPDIDDAFSMDWFSWQSVQSIVVSKKSVTFNAETQHTIPYVQLAPQAVIDAALGTKQLPYVIDGKMLHRPESANARKRLPSFSNPTLNEFLKFAVSAYSAYKSGANFSLKRSVVNGKKKSANKSSVLELFQDYSYSESLTAVQKKVQILKNKGRNFDAIDAIVEFYHSQPRPDLCLWMAQEYKSLGLKHHVVYCADEGLRLIEKQGLYGSDLAQKLRQLKSE